MHQMEPISSGKQSLPQASTAVLCSPSIVTLKHRAIVQDQNSPIIAQERLGDTFPLLREREQQFGWVRWLCDVKVEKHGKRRLFISLVFYLICGWINIVFCNLADIRRHELQNRGIPPTTILPDIAHDLIPHIIIPHLPDYFIITMAGITIPLIARHKHRLGVLRRFLYVHGSLLLFRSLTIVSTTLPDPQARCASRQPKSSVFASVNPLFPDTCGDMMFSGHTVVLTLMALIWSDYGPQIRWVRACIWALAIGGILSLLMLRFHYTIDVLIALNLTRSGWRWYGYIAQNPGADPFVAYLERRSSEKDFERAVQVVREHRRIANDKVGAFITSLRVGSENDSSDEKEQDEVLIEQYRT